MNHTQKYQKTNFTDYFTVKIGNKEPKSFLDLSGDCIKCQKFAFHYPSPNQLKNQSEIVVVEVPPWMLILTSQDTQRVIVSGSFIYMGLYMIVVLISNF